MSPSSSNPRLYKCDFAPADIDYDDLPEIYRMMPLPQFIDQLPEDKDIKINVFVLFDVPGYRRADVYGKIYYRPSRHYPRHFPIIRLEMGGKIIDEDRESAWNDRKENGRDARNPKGTMFGKGAFRSLIQYLELNMPNRGYEGIFLEEVGNKTLMEAAIRYGFERVIDTHAGKLTDSLTKNFAIT